MRKLRVDYIPAEQIWKVYWGEMGTARSLKKLSLWCKNHNIVHPLTQKPPTRDGLNKAMWRWASRKENQEEAYRIMNEGFMSSADYMTKKEFLEVAKDKITYSYQPKPKRLVRFLRRHGYAD